MSEPVLRSEDLTVRVATRNTLRPPRALGLGHAAVAG